MELPRGRTEALVTRPEADVRQARRGEQVDVDPPYASSRQPVAVDEGERFRMRRDARCGRNGCRCQDPDGRPVG